MSNDSGRLVDSGQVGAARIVIDIVKFHKLKGYRKNELAVSVTGNWRITFEFIGEDASNVNLEDYH